MEPIEHYTALILPNTVSLVQEFCVDVSAYQPVQWVEREDQECDTIFVKKCDWKKEVIIEIHPTVKSLLDIISIHLHSAQCCKSHCQFVQTCATI